MRLSTSTCILEKILWKSDMYYSCKETIEACSKAGYKVLDMNFASYSRGTLPMTKSNWLDWVKGIKDFSNKKGFEYSQAHAHFYNWENISDDKIEWHEELIRRSIIGAGIMGAKWIVIHPGSVNDKTWYSHKKSLKKNTERYNKYAEIAAQNGVKIAIENMIEHKAGRRYCSSTEELLELLDVLDDNIFGICWDTGHAHLANINQSEALRDIEKNLKALHIADNRGFEDAHLAPYFGKIKWEPIMKTLKEIGYEGDLTYEIHGFGYGLPKGLHEEYLRFTYEIGNHLLSIVN